ncbi:hypothetical protein TI05_03255 [Achromatium sp. WMS3]|nr:hypothetical protein TI05_03255 [Achromatium sp. WMS3]
MDFSAIYMQITSLEPYDIYLLISRLLTIVASSFLTFGLYHQVWKIFQTKSAKDFTATLIISLLLNETIWFNYGFAISEWPIMFITGINLPAVVLTAIGYYYYGRN